MHKIQAAEPWDWYDGIVTGLVRVPPEEGVFLASAVAWSQASRRRALCLLPLSSAQADDLRAIVKGGWENAVEGIRAFCRRQTGGARLIVVDDHSDDILAERSVEVAAVAEDLVGTIEDAMSPGREHWLAAPGHAPGDPPADQGPHRGP